MRSELFAQLKPAILLLAWMTLITGIFYPLAVTGIAQAFFPQQANGSMIEVGDRTIGSSLIGQPFDRAEYFWGRLSATSPYPYNAAASAGSNLGPMNPALTQAVQKRIEALHAADPENSLPVPVDLVTASGSGLDPHISVAAAMYQVPRVAHTRGLSVQQVEGLVNANTQDRQLWFLGEPRVNVLQLNLSLDGLR